MIHYNLICVSLGGEGIAKNRYKDHWYKLQMERRYHRYKLQMERCLERQMLVTIYNWTEVE
jgi:hypothetical protein